MASKIFRLLVTAELKREAAQSMEVVAVVSAPPPETGLTVSRYAPLAMISPSPTVLTSAYPPNPWQLLVAVRVLRVALVLTGNAVET